MRKRKRSFTFSDGVSYPFEVIKCYQDDQLIGKVIFICGIGRIDNIFKSVKVYMHDGHCYILGKLLEPDFAEGFYDSPTYSSALIYYTNKAATEEYYFSDDEEDEAFQLNEEFFGKYKKEGIRVTLCNEVIKLDDDKLVFVGYKDEVVTMPYLQQLTLGTGKLPSPVKSII